MAKVKHAVIQDNDKAEGSINTKYLSRVLRYLAPYKKEMTIALIAMLISSVAELAGPYILKIALDDYITQGIYKGVPLLALAILLSSAISALGLRYKVRFMNISGRKALAELRRDLFSHIQDLGFDFFDSRSNGKIMVRVINDVNTILNLFNNGIINSITRVFQVIIIAVIMLSLNFKLALIAFSTLPFLFIVVFVLRPYIRRNWRNVRNKISAMNGYLQETLSGMKTTQAFVREDENIKRFDETNNDIRKTWIKGIKLNNLIFPCFEIIMMTGTVLIYFFGIRFMYSGAVDAIKIGVLISMTMYLGRFWQPLNELSNIYTQVLVAMASLERIFEIMDYPVLIKNKKDAKPLKKIEGHVEFENVTFGYTPEQTVLKDVSFDVAPGQSIAFVGPTGAGKSTIINLLSRFYDIREGSIKVDGIDVRDIDLNDLRTNIGIMLQETFMFAGTIIDNVRYGKLDATDEEIIQACKAVNAHDFIMQMEKGYHTQVGERGSRLSMGQRQLISFARTLLADPHILILDEATASIDTNTEILIQKAIEVVLKGRTSFVIAHRLSTIRNSDMIMVINDQGIAERGSHDELMVQKGHYYELCKAQYDYLKAV